MNDHQNTVLIIDDDQFLCQSISDSLKPKKFLTYTAKNGQEGIELSHKHKIDIILLDQKLPDGEGYNFCQDLMKYNDKTKIIFITAYPSFDNSLKAIENGAFSYLSKPFDLKELNHIIKNCIRTINLERGAENLSYNKSKEIKELSLIGENQDLKNIKELIEIASSNTNPVLITGETGTGKTFLAKIIHHRSNQNGPLISINCSAVPENLIESELFGYEKGAFTGAVSTKKGLFELAENGTLFLDEIGEMNINLQSKLLSVLDDNKIRRIGGTVSRYVNFRLIAATNSDIDEKLKSKTFRDDLFYRLNVLRIHIPPLRERPNDLPLLINHFLKSLAPKKNYHLDEEEIELLTQYNWKGNIRELRNVMERAILLTKDDYLKISDLLENFPDNFSSHFIYNAGEILSLKEVEIDHIKYVLHKCKHNLTHTAKLLKISLSTLKRKIKKYNL
ncbi:MAG: sigma-54-dependent transcriptional regulator [bacterium]